MNLRKSRVSSHVFNLKNFISKKQIQLINNNGERYRIFDPVTTLYCFLFQVLHRTSSKHALSNLNINRAKLGQKLISMNTGAYTRAKARLSESKLLQVAKETGREIDKRSSHWRWNSKDVYLIDGTVINLEDTEDIKKQYPQTYSNNKAQGQPKMRLLGLFSLASGAFLDCEIGN